MIILLLLVLVAFCYAAFVGLSWVNFVVGLLLSAVVMSFLPQTPRFRGLSFNPFQNIRIAGRFFLNCVVFFFDFVWDLTWSNLYLAYEVWTIVDHYDPLIIYVPVQDLSDLELAILSSRITLTPGTLSLDVTADREMLVVHCMFSSMMSPEDLSERLRRPIDILRRNL